MAREIGKFKTLKGVVKDAAGKPIVTVLPDGQFDVLCNGNNGDCNGCVYKRNGWRCGAMCRDKDHIHFIHNRFLGDILTKDKRKDEDPALKPCPECKTGKAKFVEIPVDCKDGHTSLFKVECTKCHAVTVYCISKKEAAEAWNNPAKMKAKQRAFIGRLLKWTNEYAKAREEREKAVIKKDYVVEVRKDGKVECTMPCLNKLKAYKVARELSECKGYTCQVKVHETMPWRGLSTFEGGKMKFGTTDGKKTVAAQKRP